MVLILPITIFAACHGCSQTEIGIMDKSYIGITVVRMIYLHKQPHNPVDPLMVLLASSATQDWLCHSSTTLPYLTTRGGGGASMSIEKRLT
jgi:hypothetical protein